MGQDALVMPNVAAGKKLVQFLDNTGIRPRVALWVHEREADRWRLWIVPAKEQTDQREFYRQVVDVVSKHRAELSGLEASDTELISDSHPAIQGLGKFIRVEDGAEIRFASSVFNGYFLPDAIILRMAV